MYGFQSQARRAEWRRVTFVNIFKSSGTFHVPGPSFPRIPEGSIRKPLLRHGHYPHLQGEGTRSPQLPMTWARPSFPKHRLSSECRQDVRTGGVISLGQK